MSEGKSKKNLRILLYLDNPLETILNMAISENFPSKFDNFGRFFSQKSFVCWIFLSSNEEKKPLQPWWCSWLDVLVKWLWKEWNIHDAFSWHWNSRFHSWVFLHLKVNLKPLKWHEDCDQNWDLKITPVVRKPLDFAWSAMNSPMPICHAQHARLMTTNSFKQSISPNWLTSDLVVEILLACNNGMGCILLPKVQISSEVKPRVVLKFDVLLLLSPCASAHFEQSHTGA